MWGGQHSPIPQPSPEDDAALIGRYQQLVRSSADVITLVDATGTIEYQSPSVESVLGYDQEALVGDPVFDHLHPDDVERIRSKLEEVLAAPDSTVSKAEYRFRHADGSWVWLASVATARENGDGYVVNSRDVSDRREAQAALEAERERYAAVVEGVNDAVAIVRDSEVEYANPQCHELLGREPGSLRGAPFLSVVAPEDHDLAAERYAQRLDPDAPDPPSRYVLRFVTADGGRRVGEVNARAIEYEGEPAVLVAIRDVTDRAEYERRLEERSEELEALNRVVRHDVRNDMSVILGWAEELEDHVDEAGRPYLEKVLSSGQHVVELTDIARDFVEALTGEETLDRGPTSLAPALSTEVELARGFYPAATVTVEGELPAVEIAANQMLPSVFANLLRNAVQHNPGPEPRVMISAAVEDGQAVVRVADNGPGVPDAAKERIFGKGEKGLDSEGTGIGLYLVRTLVEGYGGDVGVEDNEPEGAVFVVRLPLAD